jgi:hypothetical protein
MCLRHNNKDTRSKDTRSKDTRSKDTRNKDTRNKWSIRSEPHAPENAMNRG